MNQASRRAQRKKSNLPPISSSWPPPCEQLPADQRRLIDPIYSRVLESTNRRRRILGLVQDALSQLRLDMKYLMFDLEATRRERDEFRRKLRRGLSRAAFVRAAGPGRCAALRGILARDRALPRLRKWNRIKGIRFADSCTFPCRRCPGKACVEP